LSTEFNRYAKRADAARAAVIESSTAKNLSQVKAVKPPSHSLELNLMLVFIYMAGRSFGILEKDVLRAA
jgi:hypothetical protein